MLLSRYMVLSRYGNLVARNVVIIQCRVKSAVFHSQRVEFIIFSRASQSPDSGPDPDREGIQSGPASTWYFKRTRITQTSVRCAWRTHTHTHTHTYACRETFKRLHSLNNFKLMFLRNVLMMCTDSCFCSTLASCSLICVFHKSHNPSKKTVKACVMLEL